VRTGYTVCKQSENEKEEEEEGDVVASAVESTGVHYVQTVRNYIRKEAPPPATPSRTLTSVAPRIHTPRRLSSTICSEGGEEPPGLPPLLWLPPAA
jgi:hypothetical protein